MSEHTLGPWYVRKWDEESWPEKRWSVGPEGETVAISPRYANIDESFGNACLCAAGPDMLHALERCIDTIETAQSMYGIGDLDMEALSYARAAIAKARGTGEEDAD